MIHLDTSFLIRSLVVGTKESELLADWLADSQGIGISTVSWPEFLCRPLSPDDFHLARRIVEAPLAFTENHASIAANLFNTTGRRRNSFPNCMIAAAAIVENVDLATSNPEDFTRFAASGLGVISP